MNLKDILKGVNYSVLNGDVDLLINDLKTDSRKVLNNDVFIAIKGFNSDGHDYIPEAISKGAKVIVVSSLVKIYGDVVIIKVDDTRVALSYMASNYFLNPKDKLIKIGVTGTSGKTTTTFIIKEMIEKLGFKCGLIGSIGFKYLDKTINTYNTTPDSYLIHKYFKECVDNDIKYVVMEVSSQSYKMDRLVGITFDVGVLTSITSDHIGPAEHSNHKEYVMCKNKLFLNSKEVIVNNDSLYLEEVLEGVNSNITSYGIINKSNLMASNINLINDTSFIGLSFNTFGLMNEEFRLAMPGKFNVYNALAALTVIKKLDLSLEIDKIKEVLENIKVRGRMETALVKSDFKVIIDYAHTDEAMNYLIKTLKEYKPTRLISVFGGGGNRAKSRRYALGEIFGRNSDLCIVTMDNPRFEEIGSINEDIKEGLDKVKARYIEIIDRKKAIEYAIDNHKDGDLILLVGKGHEEYQDIKGVKYPFSELEIIEKYKNM